MTVTVDTDARDTVQEEEKRGMGRRRRNAPLDTCILAIYGESLEFFVEKYYLFTDGSCIFWAVNTPQNAFAPFRTPLAELTALPQAPSLAWRGSLPLPKNPTPLSALRASIREGTFTRDRRPPFFRPRTATACYFLPWVASPSRIVEWDCRATSFRQADRS